MKYKKPSKTRALSDVSYLKTGLTLFTALVCLTQRSTALSTTCLVGEYLILDTNEPHLMQGVCATCPRGSMCPLRNPPFTAPQKCSSGQYSAFKASECTDCPEGWYCSAPDALPVPCPKGHFSTIGATSCSQCSAGTVCKADGKHTPCQPGQFCDSTYPEPKPCPAGKKCPTPDQEQDCNAGEYSEEGSTSCTKCPRGQWCPSTDHVPLDCPVGYFADEEGSTGCQDCDAGKICPDATLPPQSCPTGQYSSLSGSTSCVQCPAGVSCNGATLTACDTGFYSEAGMSNCLECPLGYECPDKTSKTACTASGTYSKNGEQYCNTCEPGYYCPSVDVEPRLCDAGWYSAAAATVCTVCPAGSSCADGSYYPKVCEEGTSSEEGATFCVGCPAGASCVDGISTFCAAGEIPQQDGKACVSCPAGMACPVRQWDKQVPCGPGYYSTEGMDYCQVSPAGYYAAKTTEIPVECATGWFADVGQTYCVQCPPGYQCKDNTGRHNRMCAPGSFYTGDGSCQACPAGKSCPIAIGGYRADGTECVDGTYAAEHSFDCELCKPGHDCSTGSKATTGSQCVDGQLCLGGKLNPDPCPANHECPFTETVGRCPIYFTSPQNQATCEPCPDGSDCWDFAGQAMVGQDINSDLNSGEDMSNSVNTIIDCTAGYYNQPLDFLCKPCPKGHYCGGNNVSVPTKCAGNTYADEGRPSCDTCPDNFYSIPGSEYCSPVPRGYRVNDAEDGIEICPHKTYSRWGERTCSPCVDGFLCPEGSELGDDWQNSCPRGSYCQAGVQTKCPAGQFGISERQIDSSACQDCPPGYNCQQGTANFELVPCPKGGYCEKGQPVVACPSGTFNDALYGKSIADCKTCPIGHTCSDEQQDAGTICGEGYYCPRGAGSKSYPCPAGTHGNSQTGKRDINECLPCPPGHYCPEGSGSPTVSPMGYYTPLSGMPSLESLYKCPPKYYCPNTAMVTYKGYFCQAGYVCPAGSYTTTGITINSGGAETECPEGTFSDRRDLHDTKHCDLCPKGYSCQSHSTTDNGRIVACPQHRYCPDGTKASSIPLCPPGTYAPFTNAKSLNDCIECPAGNFCDGTVDNTQTAVGTQTCLAGHYCPPGTSYSDQFPCAPGYYNDGTGDKSANDCKHCGFNNYCPGYGEIAPTQCESGTYNTETTSATQCVPCEAGYECLQPMVYPAPCSIGMYSPKGSTECTYCPVGTYCPNEATTDADLKNQLCPAGTFCYRLQNYSLNGVIGDHPVGLTLYPNKKDGTDGHACPLYKYCPKGTTKALDIPRGTMQELWARGSLHEVIQMPPGNYSMPNYDADGVTFLDPPYLTTECLAGHYCPAGSYEAIPCPTGSFRANILGKDQDSCGPCPAGTYCETVGTSVPIACPAGHFCPEGANQAQACPRGTYYGGTGLYDSRGCTACASGHYCPFMGQISYDQVNNMCDAGFYCIAGSSRPEPIDDTTGSRCPAGGYCVKGTPAPEACAPGQYGPYVGARSLADCIPCRPGYYCLGEDSTDATSKCAAGYYCEEGVIDYNDYATVSNAGIAQPGYYAPEGSSEPIKCPEGQFNGDEGRGDCDNCGAGYFCDGLGTTKDLRPQCEVGHYCPSFDFFLAEKAAAENARIIAGETAPLDPAEPLQYRQIPCEPGTYNDLAAKTMATDCKACPATKACERKALSDPNTLPLCAAGYFCKSGATSRYPDLTGSTAGPCPAGHYCLEGTEEPTPCPAGTWSNQERATGDDYCMPCPPGYLCTGTGNTAPHTNCPAGSYCEDGLASPGCMIANGIAGVYCPLGSQFELICPMGFYQTASEQGRCIDCPSGSYCMNGSSATCDYGFYCP